MKKKSSAVDVLIEKDPDLIEYYTYGTQPWPAWWICDPKWDGHSHGAWAFKRTVKVTKEGVYRIHVSADQRFDLYLNGERIGWGPERGDLSCWYYSTYDLTLSKGTHTLTSRVWWGGKGDLTPYAHISAEPGFVVYGEKEANELFTTGVADWKVKAISGIDLIHTQIADAFCVVGGRTVINGNKYSWGFEEGKGIGWNVPKKIMPAAVRAQGNEVPINQWWLKKSILPKMYEKDISGGKIRWVDDDWKQDMPILSSSEFDNDKANAQKWLDRTAKFTVKAGSKRAFILDIEQYVCGWANITCSGGKDANITVGWAESLSEQQRWAKGNRNDVESKYFRGISDAYILDGKDNKKYEPLWWSSGRYILIVVEAKDSDVVLENFSIRETHYPYAFESQFNCSDKRWSDVETLSKRVLEMCSHESYMDCPYYEQLMYAGDTRLEVLTTHALTRDDLLPRKAIWMFDLSRAESGFTTSRYPSKVKQVIPPFSLWWSMMVYDFAMWRGDKEFIKARIRGVRAVLEAFRGYIDDDGMLHSPLGWNFVDWAIKDGEHWNGGRPPGFLSRRNGTLNLHAAWVFRTISELEMWLGEPLLAQRDYETAEKLAKNAKRIFWDEKQQLFADDLEHTSFSEHIQCMAILSGFFEEEKQGLLDAMASKIPDERLTQTTIYFSYYLFEAFAKSRQLSRIYHRFDLWFGLREKGFFTLPEMPEPTRSDCHAWGSHALFHAYTSLSGIRPASPEFSSISIIPQPCGMKHIKTEMVHPRGMIRMDIRETEIGIWVGEISVPDAVPCCLILPNGTKHNWDGGMIKV